MRSLLAAAAVLVCTAAGLVTFASPAAALPTCLGVSMFGSGADEHPRPTTRTHSRDGNCVLGRGSVGLPVNHLQRTLVRCYGQAIAVDSEYGPATEQAVKNVQRFHGVTVDGVFGPQTNIRMFWLRRAVSTCVGIV